MSEGQPMWRIWVDTGGTFTDCLAQDPTGVLHRVKVLSNGTLRARISEVISPREIRYESQWDAPKDFAADCEFRLLSENARSVKIESHDGENKILHLSEPLDESLVEGGTFEIQFNEEAPIVAARLATRTPRRSPLPRITMHLATTKGTNALLERRGDPTAFFVTHGFEDLLRIGTQQRPDLFAMKIEKPEPLYSRVIGVNERLDADGNVSRELDLDVLKPQIDALVQEGFRTAAIALMHSYQNPAHEERLKALLLERGFGFVCGSAELSPFIKILPRAETAVVNAYLAPLMNAYLDRVKAAMPDGQLRVMTSAGGLISRDSFHPKDSLLSGPAGGVVGAATSARAAGISRIIGFDMGGTSTDVARFDGKYDYRFEQTIGGAHLMVPALKIETVAAGGGSICGYHANGLFVGPESAGASPGPACYGAGGPLTITDVNLLLGRMDASQFGIPVDVKKSRERLEEIRAQISNATGEDLPAEELLSGFLNIANERMSETVRKISVREGYDPREYALVAFGGAGGQHACQVAEKLGVEKIVFPADAGLLSARGLQFAVMERFVERQILQPLSNLESRLETLLSEVAAEARTALIQEGVTPREVEIQRRIFQLRLTGQEATETIEFSGDESLRENFEARYRSVFGYFPEDKEIEVVSLRVVAGGTPPALPDEEFLENAKSADSQKTTRSWARSQWSEVPVFHRINLETSQTIQGPAIIQDAYSTVVVEDGWKASVGSHATLMLAQTTNAVSTTKTQSELVELELFTNRFCGIVEEMGSMVERTAVSTNVKERRDFSCALLDASAELVVNAPHIPVHLGALGICVRTVLQHCKLKPGDMIVTNHPAFGGSHLPDVTVISPVFERESEQLIGYVANRAHHAEIGGIRPGSMSPSATCLAEEGVVIPPTFLFRNGKPRYDAVEKLLTESEYPTRALADNLADLKAQAAANLRGVALLQELATRWSPETVAHFCRRLKDRAAEALAKKIATLDKDIFSATQSLDDGTPLAVRIERTQGGLSIDFTGTGGVHPGNLNATPAIVTSAIIYFLRVLIQKPIPLNEGLLRNVKIEIPEGILNPPFPDDPRQAPAAVGGNVETSQRLVDTLIAAFVLSACSQGTMNNLIFGNERVSYYETICGGQGAGRDFDGASAVHTHMTNTGITDPEILEQRYPVTLERFEIRRGSGGKGKHHGGDGIVRELKFREPVSLSLLTQHREEGPFGIHGGESGAVGKQTLFRKSGTTEELSSTAQVDLEAGDRFIIETPGGGGCGKG